jgi:hypothetical protein
MNLLRIVLASGVALLTACGASDPGAEVRALLTAAEQAAEARDTGFFRDVIATAYRDSAGRDRDQVVNSVRGLFVANQKIEIVSRIDSVELQGADAARAVVHAGLIGQRAGASMLGGLDADLYRFDLELVKNGGDWQIIGARVTPARGE